MRTRHYKLYKDGRYFDLRADPMEKRPLKKITGGATENRKLLEEAFLKLNYPGKK